MSAWPPPPHDPRERVVVLSVAGWEVRIFDDVKVEYFVTRGFWHLQLWHAAARFSVLTPSRLTCGMYELFPVADWKARVADYEQLVALAERARGPVLPSRAQLSTLEQSLGAGQWLARGRLVS